MVVLQFTLITKQKLLFLKVYCLYFVVEDVDIFQPVNIAIPIAILQLFQY